MFITQAFAQTAGASGTSSDSLLQLAPFLLIGVIFWLFLFRPQQQQSKLLKAAQAGIRRGDRIITAGGVIGTVTRIVNDDEVEIQIAEGVKIRVVRSTIPTITAKTEPSTNIEKPAKKPAEKDKSSPFPSDEADEQE